MYKRLQSFALHVALVSALILSASCGSVSLFRGGTAREHAVQALITATRSCVVLMTAAGIAYDAGAFGAPGSPRAEDTWNKIAAESLRMNEALTAWTEAIKMNRDAAAYATMVAQALAVIGALLPPKMNAEANYGLPFGIAVTITNLDNVIGQLRHPSRFHAPFAYYAMGGAR
jgi:hypothetical protein